MKSLILSLVTAALLPLFAVAEPNISFPPPGAPFNHQNRIFVMTTPICYITHVLFYVTGDNLRIDDADVMFGNGSTQDIATRGYFKENSWTTWKDLKGQKRCIQGFALKARPDADWNNARVHLYGWRVPEKGRQEQVYIGSALIRDFGNN